MDMILGALKSKTIWVAVATILLGALADPVQAWIAANPGVAASVAGVVMAVLRGLTTGSLSDKGQG
jgi:uncharacterized lipoprotein YajG